MTTEKEFWNLAGQYFRKELGISEDEQTIDEECVGCCRVQCDTELIERLSTEIHNLDKTIKDFKAIEKKETDRLHEIILDMDVTISDLMDNDRKMNGFLDEYRATVENLDKTIEELKDRNIKDLHELYDLYEKELRRLKHVISARDLTIKSLTVMCQSSGSIRNDLTSTIEDQKRTIDHFINCIGGLEAELSARKEDSAVLAKVVEIVREWQNLSAMVSTYDMRHLRDLVKDYLDAPEGPPETPIDDLYKVTVTYAFLEMP